MSTKVYYGKEAVRYVESITGKLTAIHHRVIELEGYVPGIYLDDRGVATCGIGQTGEWIERGFLAAFDAHLERCKRMIPDYPNLPEYVQAELMQAEYRGDLGGSPTFRRLFNGGRLWQAATEFLNNNDYRTRKRAGGDGVTARMEAVADACRRYARELIE